MRLVFTSLVFALNALLAISSLYTTVPQIASRPSLQSIFALLVSAVPCVSVALFAFGKRTKNTWAVAAALNLLVVLVAIGMALYLQVQFGREAGRTMILFAPALIIGTVNLAYLLNRIPQSA